ncbi:MAG: tRNA pseudouridine(55) synthase TruB, partial [Clostridiales bacterium]|nr:tRNA pseudouridine(55) synthase TruB [Clostridiales bacterium]
MTSRQAVSRVARLTGEKAGHAGTLDPQACGVLPILLGKATRLFDFVAGERKQYLAEIHFGMETDTQDAEGTIAQDGGRIPPLQEVLDVLPGFVGDSLQEPPAYSAKKIGGVRAHKLARAGDAPVMAAQTIQVHAITHVAQTAEDRHLIRVVCSKGTYIRTLCRD